MEMPKYLSRADLERIGGTVVNQYYRAIAPRELCQRRWTL